MSCPRTYKKCTEISCGLNNDGICSANKKMINGISDELDTYNFLEMQTHYCTGIYFCTICGDNVTLYESYSNKGHNLICKKCLKEYFNSIEDYRENYKHL